MDGEKMASAERWFKRWGVWGILIGHSLPGIRSVISFPAGLSKMDRKKFVAFTFSGALVWNTVLVTAGYLLGGEWVKFWEKTDSLHLDILMLGGLGAILILYFLYNRRKGSKVTRPSDSE